MRRLSLLALPLCALGGCGGQGSVTFELRLPAQASPLTDPRRDSVTITDEITGQPLGARASVRGAAGEVPVGELPIGTIRVGTYDVRMTVTGGGQLIGLARTPKVRIASGSSQRVVLHLRKPLAMFGAGTVFPALSPVLPPSAPLNAFDTTLANEGGDIDIPLGATAGATASTSDGRYLVAGSGSRLFVVDTADLKAPSVQKGALPGKILSIAISPDDATAAVVTDQGVAVIGDLPAFAAGGDAGMIPVTPLPSARVAVFDHARHITVLSGPAWDQIDCAKRPLPRADLYSGTIGDRFDGPTRTLDAATDIAYDANDRLLVVSPCDRGVFDTGGQLLLEGAGIHDILLTGDGRLLGVGGELVRQRVPFDPDDPRQRDIEVPYARVLQLGRQPTPFRVPPYRISLELADIGGSEIKVELNPSRIDAYDAAVSPDGAHVVFAQRIRYEAREFNYFQLVDQRKVPYYYCILNATEDVFGVTQVDINSGRVELQTNKGITDSSCIARCYLCNQLQKPPCPLNAEQSCRFSDGFAPTGVSVLMGAQ